MAVGVNTRAGNGRDDYIGRPGHRTPVAPADRKKESQSIAERISEFVEPGGRSIIDAYLSSRALPYHESFPIRPVTSRKTGAEAVAFMYPNGAEKYRTLGPRDGSDGGARFFAQGTLSHLFIAGALVPSDTAEAIFAYTNEWCERETSRHYHLVICEGETDALTVVAAGLGKPVPRGFDGDIVCTSVPAGAPPPNHANNDHGLGKRFAFLEHNEQLILGAARVILATDHDAAGDALAEELARRIGRERCYRASFEGCKDANELNIKEGPDRVWRAINEADPYPIAGLQAASEYFDVVRKLYENPHVLQGQSTGIEDLDNYYRISPGELCIVTGLPNDGKSMLIDQIMINMAKNDGECFAVCSFENPVEKHLIKLAEMYLGLDFRPKTGGGMTREQLDQALSFIEDHFVFLTSAYETNNNIESIIERIKAAVYRKGIKGAIIDPYNYMDCDNENETAAIRKMLRDLRKFAIQHGIHIWIVAHTTKISGDRIARGYDIYGSSHWYAMADVGITVKADKVSRMTDIIVWKVRYHWSGQVGQSRLLYSCNGLSDAGDFLEDWEP